MKRFVLPLTVMISLLFGIMVTLTVLAGDQEFEFDMNDRFSASGAGGDGEVEVEDGSMDLEIEATGLQANTNYEVVVTIGPKDSFGPFGKVFRFPVTIDEDGELDFETEEFDLGLAPDTYRFDFFVMLPGDDPAVGPYPLACQPASVITVGDDDDDADDDDD